MSLIYKPSQGYWVRTMTAVFVGVLVLAGAGWAWQQLELVRLPTPTWNVDVAGVSADRVPAAGETVRLLDTGGAEVIELGSAVVQGWTPGTRGAGTLVLGSVSIIEAGAEVSAADTVRAGDGAGVWSARLRSARGVPIFEPTYLQAAGAGLVLLVGAGLVYWLVGVKPKTVDFLIATDGEMKKVNWSTRREVTGSTIVVVVATFLIAAVLFVIDYGFSTVFSTMGVLER